MDDNDTWGELLPDGTTVVHGTRRYPISPSSIDNTNVNQSQYRIQPSDIPNIANDYISSAKSFGSDILNEVKEHPASLLAGLLGPELGVPTSIATGIGGYLIDATHPLTNQVSDFYTQSPKEIIKNALVSGIMNGATGLLKTPEINDNALKSAISRSPISGNVKTEFTTEAYPGNIATLSEQEPSMIEAPSYTGFDRMVGNPNVNVNTPQYQEALSKLGTPDNQPISAYRGVHGSFLDPRIVKVSDRDADIFTSGYTPDDFAKSYSYQEIREPQEVRDAVDFAIKLGHPDSKELQKLVDNFNPIDKETIQPLYKAAIDKSIIRKPNGIVQDLKIFPENPVYLDYHGNPIFDPSGKGNIIEPEQLYGDYWNKGHDAVVIDNVRDPHSSMIQGATNPSRVVVVNPNSKNIIKSTHNYGSWNTLPGNTDLLKGIGLTTGLGTLNYEKDR